MSLKARLKVIRRCFRHPTRAAERELLERILYRNASQHRGTRHLRLLRCAVRARSRLDALPLWPYIIDCELEEIKQDLLEQIVQQYRSEWERFKQIVFKAQKELLKLISQSFFLPICVAAWSGLARLYCIELKLSSEVVGLLSANSDKKQEEDIGEIVSTVKQQTSHEPGCEPLVVRHQVMAEPTAPAATHKRVKAQESRKLIPSARPSACENPSPGGKGEKQALKKQSSKTDIQRHKRIRSVARESLMSCTDFESTTANSSSTAPSESDPKRRSEPAVLQWEGIDASKLKADSRQSPAPAGKAENRKRSRLHQSSEIDDIFGDL
ncbi:hypothetical protein NDN08_001305 [Rhodosorus marinus]|uniref:Nucleolus and neural progenitor protein-like N-terminal domain-containing protein n=1 Tax=Rhodosorus marinus TaxID=101924 RepID=A0AAV8UQE3_9RHOD|nr:hypothetical protein NDN08_001305 [Rhodosorus marinus]